MTTEPFDVAVAKAMLAQLGTTASLGYPLACPFVTFTPPSTGSYIDARALLRGAPDRPGFAAGSSVYRRGIFQIDAVVPDSGQGESPGLRIAAVIAARFPFGSSIKAGSGVDTYRVRIDYDPVIAAAVKDAPWVRFPVSVRYLVITRD